MDDNEGDDVTMMTGNADHIFVFFHDNWMMFCSLAQPEHRVFLVVSISVHLVVMTRLYMLFRDAVHEYQLCVPSTKTHV